MSDLGIYLLRKIYLSITNRFFNFLFNNLRKIRYAGLGGKVVIESSFLKNSSHNILSLITNSQWYLWRNQ
jgi:hypothetical protein